MLCVFSLTRKKQNIPPAKIEVLPSSRRHWLSSDGISRQKLPQGQIVVCSHALFFSISFYSFNLFPLFQPNRKEDFVSPL